MSVRVLDADEQRAGFFPAQAGPPWQVYLVYAYAKSKSETLPRAQEKELQRLAKVLDGEE